MKTSRRTPAVASTAPAVSHDGPPTGQQDVPGSPLVAPAPVPDVGRPGLTVDQRPRWRRMLPPIATIIGLFLATLYVRQVDPNVPGHYPGCPTQVFLGIDCPGCGGLRATHELAQGDLAAAVDHNLLVVLLVPFVAFLLVAWLWRAWTGVVSDTTSMTTRQKRTQQIVPIVLLVVMAVFTIVRNVTPYGAAGIG